MSGMFYIWAGLISCLAVYVGIAILIFFRQGKLLYYPVCKMRFTSAQKGVEYEDIYFATPDGIKLNAWYIPVQHKADNSFTILFCHGNGGNMGYYIDTLKILSDMNVNCLAFDYRGYGRSQGKPNEQGTYTDVLAAYKWLITNKHVQQDKIILFGRSLGGSIAAQLSTKVRVGGLWLENTFTSFGDMGSYYYPYYPVRWFANYSYNTMQYLKQVRCPVLVVHSPNDEIVPFKMGQRLYEIANEPKRFVAIEGGHNEAFIASNGRYTGPVCDWLNSIKEQQSLGKNC